MKLEKMSPMTPKADGSDFNPFHQDTHHMGQSVGKHHFLLFANFANEPLTYLIIVNTQTGERYKLIVNSDAVDDSQQQLKLFIKQGIKDAADLPPVGTK